MAETQSQANAALIAHYIDEMGRNITDAMKFRFQRDLEEKRVDQSALQRIKDFMSLPAEKRKALLLDPSFRSEMIKTLDPSAFRGKRETKRTLANADLMQQKQESVMALGEATPDEILARQKAQQDLVKSQAEAAKAKTEQQLLETKKQFATGERVPTAMDLLTNFDFKDPLAATLATAIPKQQLTDIALASKNAGPLYEKQQQQEWYQKMLQEGLPPGIAIQSAIAIAGGKWNEVPLAYTDAATGRQVPIRAKAEQQLMIEVMNANSRMQEVQNTISSSVATSAAQLAEKSGLSLDQARQNVVAMRSGKPAPFPTPLLTEHVYNDQLIQKQTIEKNAQSILQDKAGIGMIRESLNSMIALYKEQGVVSGTLTSAQKTDLGDKIQQTQQELTARLAGLYGIKYSKYEELHTFAPAVKAAMGQVYSGMKAAGALGVDLSKDAVSSMDSVLGPGATEAIKGNAQSAVEGVKGGFEPRSVMEGVTGPAMRTAKPVHTPEQESVLKSLATSFEAALNNPNTPPEQKKKLQDYINKTLIPVYNDPSRFLELFTTPTEVQ